MPSWRQVKDAIGAVSIWGACALFLYGGVFALHYVLSRAPPTPDEIKKAKLDLEISYVKRCMEYRIQQGNPAMARCRLKMIEDDAADDAVAEDSRPTPY